MLGQEMSPVAKGGQAAASAYASPHEEGTAHAFSRLKKKKEHIKSKRSKGIPYSGWEPNLFINTTLGRVLYFFAQTSWNIFKEPSVHWRSMVLI